MPSRRIRENIYGNIYGYIGTRRAESFGTDKILAELWLYDSTEYEALMRERSTIVSGPVRL